VELAGLEPATSWVRSRRSLALSLACLQGFRVGEARSVARDFGQFPLVSAEIGPKKPVFGPISSCPGCAFAGSCPFHSPAVPSDTGRSARTAAASPQQHPTGMRRECRNHAKGEARPRRCETRESTAFVEKELCEAAQLLVVQLSSDGLRKQTPPIRRRQDSRWSGAPLFRPRHHVARQAMAALSA
jgi:hypothetical protein